MGRRRNMLVGAVLAGVAGGGLAACSSGGSAPASTASSVPSGASASAAAASASAQPSASATSAGSAAQFTYIIEPFDPGHPARVRTAPANCGSQTSTLAIEQCYEVKTATDRSPTPA